MPKRERPIEQDDMFTEEQNELIESAAEMLCGLIHARFILTSKECCNGIRTMILADAQEFTALDNPAFRWVSRILLGQVLWKYFAQGVKTFTILIPSIKATSMVLTSELRFPTSS